MKKAIFILLMSFTLARAQTNVYHEFPDSAACWQETAFWGTTCSVTEYRYFYLNGDTVFSNGNIYQKVSQSGYFSCNSPPYYTSGTYFIREDVSQKKVYYINPSNNTEQILYDFTMSAGDTLASTGYIIVSVDSVNINGSYRKRWKTDSQLSSMWDTICIIEGIGSTSSVLHPIFGSQGVEHGNHLSTFYTNGQCEYEELNPFFTYGCACTTTQVTEVRKSKFTVSPNPATDLIVITSEDAVRDIEIKDLQGRVVFRSENKNTNATLDIRHLENGVYFISKSTGTYKFIKQ